MLKRKDALDFHFPNANTANARGLIAPSAKFHEICVKMLDAGRVYVVDFDDECRFIGLIGKAEYVNAINIYADSPPPHAV